MTVDAAYPGAPAVLVTMEIRHPATDFPPGLSSGELKRLLIDDLPIESQAQDVAWVMGSGGSPTPTGERFVRYVNRDSTLAAAMKTQAIVIETTDYSNFQTLLDVVMRGDRRSRVPYRPSTALL